ncbi:MAG: hypothetical protein ACRDRX_04420 [Pseudonocardiaceae bacterium]
MPTSPVSDNRVADQLRALSRELRAGDQGEIAKQLRKAIRQAAGPALADVRKAMLELDVTGENPLSVGNLKSVSGGGRRARAEHSASRVRTERGKTRARRRAGLRQLVATATSVKVRDRGVRFECDASRLPVDQRSLPRALESPAGWRHPVFGNREVWAKEVGGLWFYPTLRSHQREFQDAVTIALNEAARKLEQKIGASS